LSFSQENKGDATVAFELALKKTFCLHHLKKKYFSLNT